MNIYQKHKPKTFTDLVIEKISTRDRLKEYNDGERNGNLILHGPCGTGKSATAEVITASRCGSNCDLHWAQTFEGATFEEDDIAKIERNWAWQRLQGVEHPVVTINEIDKMSKTLQAKLQAFGDTHAQYGSIIATTNAPYHVNRSLLDRFDPVEMPATNPEAWIDRVKQILSAERVACDDNELRGILSTTNGSIRDVMSAVNDMVIKKRSLQSH